MTRIAHLMTPQPAVITATATAASAGALMTAARLRHLPVVDQTGALIGILSDRDLRGPMVGAGSEGRPAPSPDATVGALMTREVASAGPDDDLGQVARIMVERRIGAVPIIDGERRPVGIVSFVDVLRRLADEADEDARAVDRIE